MQRLRQAIVRATNPSIWPIGFLFVLGLAVTFVLWRSVTASIETTASARFDEIMNEVHAGFSRRISSYEQVLRGGAAFFHTVSGLTREQFGTYVAGLDLPQNYPGLVAIGYSVRVAGQDLSRQEANVREQGLPDVQNRPAEMRQGYWPILFIAPNSTDQQNSAGLDFFAEAGRREAMIRSGDTGEAAISPPVIRKDTVGDIWPAGFVLFLPVYENNAPLTSVAQRQQALRGFVFSPFRLRDLIGTLLERADEVRGGIADLAINDLKAGSARQPLFTTVPPPRLDADYQLRIIEQRFGLNWEFVFASTPGFEKSVDFRPAYIAATLGIIASGLLSIFVAGILRRKARLARALEHHAMLTRELSHRVRNTLAIVQAIAHRSISGDRNVDDARKVFLDRLHALANAHTLLFNSNWSGASLRDIVVQELAPYGKRALFDGPDVVLNANVAQTFALVLHELATNAVNYGALSNEEGRVIVRWWITKGSKEHAMFMFTWIERDGPPIEAPQRRGFGRLLLAQAIGHGAPPPNVTFSKNGLRYELTAPLASLTAADGLLPPLRFEHPERQ